MGTIGHAIGALEEQVFTDRQREVATFRAWLADDARPTILNVSGRGGVGKSALLRAFRRAAADLDRGVILVDRQAIRATPEELLRALGGASLDEVVARLNDRLPLLLVDTFEALGDLTRYLAEELLPRLAVGVRLTVAGRHPLGLAWLGTEGWRTLVRPLPLESFAPDESRAYLARRGLRDAQVVELVLGVAGGHPLALSLAADLAVQFGVRDFAAASAWHLAVRSLVE